MAIAKGLSVFMNGVPLGCALQSLEATANTEALDATTLCNTARKYQPGTKDGTASASGIWDYDSTDLNEIHDVFSAAYDGGGENVITATLAAIGVNVDAIMFNSVQTSYNIEVQNNALIMCNADFQAVNGINYGKILFNAAVNNTTTNGTTVDGAASSANGGLFQVQVQNPSQLAGSIKLQHSTDGSTWVDVSGGSITLTSANKYDGKYVEVTGTIQRYVRAVAAATSGEITFVAAFARR